MKNTLFIFILLLVVSSCEISKSVISTSKIIANIKSKKLEKIVKQNDFKINYFSGKIRVLYKNKNFTAHFRMKKDSVIWISMTGPFSIEGARILITKDRVQIINRLNGTYYDEPLSFIENFLPLNVNFQMLEQLILGNFIEKAIKKQKIETKAQNYIVKGEVENFNLLYFLLPNGKLESIEIENKYKVQSIDVQYKKYEKFDNQEFSVRREFLIKDTLSENILDLKFYKMKTEMVHFPFKVLSSLK